MKTDDLMIINPYVEHTEKTLPNNPMEYIVFGVEGLAFSFDDPEQDASKGYSFYSYGSDKNQFINFAQLMMHEFQEQKPGFEKVCHGLLEVLLVYISRKQNLSVISESSFQLSKECALAKRYIDTADRRIEACKELLTTSDLSVTQIASSAGFSSQSYFSQIFNKKVGMSPRQYRKLYSHVKRE